MQPAISILLETKQILLWTLLLWMLCEENRPQTIGITDVATAAVWSPEIKQGQ